MQPQRPKRIPADPTLRLLTLLTVLVVTGIGAVGLLYTSAFLDRVKDLAGADPEAAALLASRTLKLLTVFLAIVPVIVGLYLGQIAIRAWHHQEFPPPGTRVLRDTVVTVGPQSRRWALLAFLIALLLVGSGILLPVWTWRIAARLFPGGAPPL